MVLNWINDYLLFLFWTHCNCLLLFMWIVLAQELDSAQHERRENNAFGLFFWKGNLLFDWFTFQSPLTI